ncbi:MAG TPA: hypothetical protein DIC34_21055, partial [Treponema sp.]|nr:hypothetical protein [Treponema sp.]
MRPGGNVMKNNPKRTTVLDALMYADGALLGFSAFSQLFFVQFPLIRIPSALSATALSACLIAALGISAYLIYELRIVLPAQARRISVAQQRLFMEEIEPLNLALAEFAIGNTAIQIGKPSTEPLPRFRSGILESVIDDFNRVQATILESIDDFNAITYEPCDRICYTGTDNYLEGEKCGEIMAHLTGGKGEVAILLNSFDKVNHRLRQKGFTNYLTRKHPAVKVVEVLETQQIPENTYKKTL